MPPCWAAGHTVTFPSPLARMEVPESGGNGLCQVEKVDPEEGQTREKMSMGEWKCQAWYGTASQCKEFLRPFKKSLRKLDLPKELPKDKKLKYTKKNLTILGDHINMFLQLYCKSWELKHWKKVLWKFVSLFSELDARSLCKLYKYSKSNQMAKFLKLYCSSENPDSVPVPENSKLTELYDAWGLHGDINNMQEKLSQIQSPPSETSLDSDSEATSVTKRRLSKTCSSTNQKRAPTTQHHQQSSRTKSIA
ncbi:CHD1 helical C-terminal domain containing protein 1 isoform X3 [Pelodiscus sinensis]|uniref:CHD1 helical C-terminal domain containing protein 1 isoform X3 n=1 Tax=Pelodiscus sinensis TaxID=13735 RepID=UPI003F6A7E21